ncbi:hypothetical protein PU11_24360 [Escherichia coli]|nr:hypothetical protein RG39_22465 [Escherichia coli]APK32164.1 hypothetical protein RG40_23640 [Escherichia coli]APL53667.1 hypothetical protein RG66_20115 [Escherichia coli]KHI93982.1 hypothetical protein PU11_24360 [Escherichia coli]KIG63562.1 hypothetical protein PU39_24215 [Escherichia coli]
MTANPTRCARLVFAQSALCLAPPRSAPWPVPRAAARSCRLSGGVLPQRRSRRHPWRLRCRSAAASSWASLL